MIQLLEAGQSLRAYHGTRHRFERFRMKSVGTGEGFQVYGYGLYFAENFEVARYYAEKLGDSVKPGDPHAGMIYEVSIALTPGSLLDWDLGLMEQSRFVQDALGDTLNRDEPMLNGATFYDSFPNMKRMTVIIARNVYLKHKTDMAAFAAEMHRRFVHASWEDFTTIIDYVQNATRTMARGPKPGRGSHLWDDLVREAGGAKPAAQKLQAIGISGIRYLDEGSRVVVDEPTHNYVIFDARKVRITRKLKPDGSVIK